MTKAALLASHGDLQAGAAASTGIGSASLDLSGGNITFPVSGRDDVPRSLRCTGAGGNVTFKGLDGYWDTWTGLSAGDEIPVAVQEVASSANGTTATLKAIY